MKGTSLFGCLMSHKFAGYVIHNRNVKYAMPDPKTPFIREKIVSAHAAMSKIFAASIAEERFTFRRWLTRKIKAISNGYPGG